MKMILMGFHSRYFENIKQILMELKIENYVFCSNINFFKGADSLKLFDNKTWPDSYNALCKVLEDDLADIFFNRIIKFKEESLAAEKIRIISVPNVNYG